MPEMFGQRNRAEGAKRVCEKAFIEIIMDSDCLFVGFDFPRHAPRATRLGSICSSS